MKRLLILPVLFFLIGFTVFAQDEMKMSVGLGPEWNMSSRSNFAGGVGFSFDYDLPVEAAPFAVGLIAFTSKNFYDNTVFVGAGTFRWYFLGKGDTNQRFTGFFAQAEVGTLLIFEYNETIPMFMGGLCGGYRQPLGTRFFVEPYGRLGYPFAFGVGALGGVRF